MNHSFGGCVLYLRTYKLFEEVHMLNSLSSPCNNKWGFPLNTRASIQLLLFVFTWSITLEPDDAHVKWVNIGPGDGMAPFRRQAIT